MPLQDIFDSLRLELRRGSLTLAVLAHLRREHYGYTLRKALLDHGLDIDEGTLYPLLRRLESQGLLLSEWREENKESFVPVPGPAKRQNTASYHARTSAGRAGMVTLPQGV